MWPCFGLLQIAYYVQCTYSTYASEYPRKLFQIDITRELYSKILHSPTHRYLQFMFAHVTWAKWNRVIISRSFIRTTRWRWIARWISIFLSKLILAYWVAHEENWFNFPRSSYLIYQSFIFYCVHILKSTSATLRVFVRDQGVHIVLHVDDVIL